MQQDSLCVVQTCVFLGLNQMGTEWVQVRTRRLPACAVGLALRLVSYDSVTVHCCALNLKT